MGAASSKLDKTVSDGIQKAISEEWVPLFMKYQAPTVRGAVPHITYATLVGDDIV